MNVRIALMALKALRYDLLRAQPRTASRGRLRLAYAWLKKAATDGLDQIARLEVLEGALGVPAGKWSLKSSPDLRGAAAALGDYPDVQQTWIKDGNSGMYNLMHRQVQGVLSRSNIAEVSADDIMMNALMGLNLDMSQGEKVLYEVGKRLSDKVLSGQESPSSVGAGLAGKFLKRKALNDINRVRRQQDIRGPEVREDEFSGIAETPTRNLGRVLMGILTSRSSRLGKEIRKLMRKVFAPSEPMMVFVDKLEKGSIPRVEEIAKIVGISPQTVKQSHWQRFMPLFAKAWKRDRKLQNALVSYLVSEGLIGQHSDLDLSDIFQSGEYGKFRRFKLADGKQLPLVAHWG